VAAEVRQHQPVLEPRPHRKELPQPLPRDDDGDATDDARSSSSTRSLLHDPQLPWHRWPPALRGWPLPEPALPLPLISGPLHRREPLPGQLDSPH
jgi:hypothetical protein